MIPLALGAKLLGARKALARVPAWLWWTLAGVLIVLAGMWLHQREVRQTIAAAEKRGEDRAYARVEAKAKEIAAKAHDASEKINAVLKERNREEAARINRAADSLRLRGPGAAACPGSAAVPAGSGGYGEAGGPGDDSLPRLPYPRRGELLAMPFDDAIAFAEQHDLNRNEALIWRRWYREQFEAWQKLSAGSGQ